MPIAPDLKRISRSLSAALGRGAFISTAGRMRVDLIGWAEAYIDTAPIGSPSGNAGSEVLIRVCDAAVMLLFVFVLCRLGSRVATKPELFDELLPLFIRAELIEGFLFAIGYDPGDILVDPAAIRGSEFLLILGFFLASVFCASVAETAQVSNKAARLFFVIMRESPCDCQGN